MKLVEIMYDYDIFGNLILTIEEGYTNAIRYAGEFYDKETGLYYLRARYYNPYTGRFISEDSYWGEEENPLSLNLYTYGHNDPIRYIDPSGHSAREIEKQIGIVDKAKSDWAEASDYKKKEGLTDHQKEILEQIQESAHRRAQEARENYKN